MVIRALNHVKRCDTAADGWIINKLVRSKLARGEIVALSFDRVSDVPSSFVNTAVVSLLDQFEESFIKKHLTITDANKQIADMVRRCLANGIRKLDS